MRRIMLLLGSIIITLGLTSFVVGQENKTAPPDTMKHIVKKKKPNSPALAELEKAKAEHVAAMQSELQKILKRINQLPDSLRHEALINEIENMQSLREFKASQYEKRLDSTAAQSQQDSTKLRLDRSQAPPEKTKQQKDAKDNKIF